VKNSQHLYAGGAMQPTAPARFLLVHLPHENQEVSAVSYSNLPMAYSEWKRKQNAIQLEAINIFHFLSTRREIEIHRWSQLKIVKLICKNYDLEECWVVPALNKYETFPSRASYISRRGL
jgi:hypothetical protein